MESILRERDYNIETSIAGKITRLFKSTENWSAGILTTDTGPLFDRECRFSVKAQLQVGDTLTLRGSWKDRGKYGYQFEASSLEYPAPDPGKAGLESYLANNPAFRGIGPSKAKIIAEAFGDDFDFIIRNEPQCVVSIAKLSPGIVDNLRSRWIERTDVNAISQWLSSFGLTHCQIKKIAAEYGNRARQILTENPYVLADDIHNVGFARADEIALKMGTPKNHPGRIRACLVDIVKKEAEQGGHTYIERKDLIKNALKKLCFDHIGAEKLVREQLAMLCDGVDSTLVVAEIDGQTLVALAKIYRREITLSDCLEDSVRIPYLTDAVCVANDVIDKAASSVGSTPSDSQREAAQMVLQSRISIISGSAGTGKSFTIALIYKIYQNRQLSVGLCAPTGKAAKRMSQLASGAPAMTIHRLLEWSPFENRFIYDADNKLPYDLVIVDEVSMCDINLLWHLFSAIDFTKSQLLLVGDHQQLPPIGCGNFLRDVLTRQLVPCHILTQCFRNAGDLKLNCNSILEGTLKPSTKRLDNGSRDWWVVDNQEDSESLIAAVRQLMETRLRNWGFDPIEDTILIVPQNRGKLGVNRFNWELQRIWQLQKNKMELPIPDPAVFNGQREKLPELMVGDKIIQTRNNYKLGTNGIMNGTLGVVSDIRYSQSEKSGKRCAYSITFEDCGTVEIDGGSEDIKDISLAYAISIHKAQGSEWPCVVSIIHKAHTFMLSKCLLYTAATRARKTAIIIGDKLGMRRALRNTTSQDRRTWLSLQNRNISGKDA